MLTHFFSLSRSTLIFDLSIPTVFTEEFGACSTYIGINLSLVGTLKYLFPPWCSFKNSINASGVVIFSVYLNLYSLEQLRMTLTGGESKGSSKANKSVVIKHISADRITIIIFMINPSNEFVEKQVFWITLISVLGQDQLIFRFRQLFQLMLRCPAGSP